MLTHMLDYNSARLAEAKREVETLRAALAEKKETKEECVSESEEESDSECSGCEDFKGDVEDLQAEVEGLEEHIKGLNEKHKDAVEGLEFDVFEVREEAKHLKETVKRLEGERDCLKQEKELGTKALRQVEQHCRVLETLNKDANEMASLKVRQLEADLGLAKRTIQRMEDDKEQQLGTHEFQKGWLDRLTGGTDKRKCLKVGCYNDTEHNWCDECMKDGDKSQSASFPFKGTRGSSTPAEICISCGKDWLKEGGGVNATLDGGWRCVKCQDFMVRLKANMKRLSEEAAPTTWDDRTSYE